MAVLSRNVKHFFLPFFLCLCPPQTVKFKLNIEERKMFPFKLERPLATIDIESTGTNVHTDKIIEIAVVKITPDGKRETKVWRVNPGMPIPPEASAVHRIYDEDIADAPRFKDIISELLSYLKDCDLCGYNLIRYDIPMLVEEFRREEIEFLTDDLRVVDVQRIFHRREPRDLTAAVRFYCDKELKDAHGARADAEATVDVLEGQFRKYKDLPGNIDELDEYCNPRDPSWADKHGRLKWVNGKITINFGKKKGESVEQLIRDDPGFIKWMLKNDFPRDTKSILEDALRGIWPNQPQDA